MGFAPVIGSGLDTVLVVHDVLCTGLAPPESSVRQSFFLSQVGEAREARLRHAFEFSRHPATGFHHGYGAGPKSTTVQIPSVEPTHDSLALHWQEWVLSGLWSPLPKGVPRFGLKRSSQLIVVGRNLETLHRNFPSFFLPSFARAQTTTRPTKLAISARTHELPSLHSVTWPKARPSIGCHRAKALLFPSWAPGRHLFRKH
ncbi:hypothetical protein F5883DRAFT_539060 [Diaporthe sp. PMI_573]|nr:hypothetical protein F5883DRAFT_539060 [Diaporthaceae sp. PMI_573]